MTVLLTSTRPAGSTPASAYLDSWCRADQPYYLGDDWHTESPAASRGGPGTIATNVNASLSGATFGTAAASDILETFFIPRNVYAPLVRAKSMVKGLFSEQKIVGKLGTNYLAGPAVFLNPNRDDCYWAGLNAANNAVRVFRNIVTVLTELSPSAFIFSLGDTVRIECNLSAGGNVLRIYQNGTLRQTIVDAAGMGPQIGAGGGVFGTVAWGGAASALQFQNYSGGILP